MARWRRAPLVTDDISSSPSGFDRCPTGISPARIIPARGEIIVIIVSETQLQIVSLIRQVVTSLFVMCWTSDRSDANDRSTRCRRCAISQCTCHNTLDLVAKSSKSSLMRIQLNYLESGASASRAMRLSKVSVKLTTTLKGSGVWAS